MYKLIQLIGIIIIVTGLASCKTEAPSKEKAVVVETAADHIAAILDMWPGFYNNDAQIAEREAAGEAIWRGDSDNDGWLNVHSHYVPISKPEIGENLLYVEEYRDNDPSLAYRQRIYKFTVDSTGTGRVTLISFKDKKQYAGAYADMSMLDNLDADTEVSVFPSICDLVISKKDGKYHMNMSDKDCAFGDKYFNYQVMLSDGLFQYRDKIMQLSNDSLLTTAAEFQYHDLKKISDY